MKKTRDLLKETFASIPSNFAYREVRFYVYHALQKLDAIEKKEGKRINLQQELLQKQEEQKKLQPWQPPIYQEALHLKNTIATIDKMIAAENKIIENINAKKNAKKGQVAPNEDNGEDDDGLQTLHG